jgi:Ketopantoate hydroxymethyltransferase
VFRNGNRQTRTSRVRPYAPEVVSRKRPVKIRAFRHTGHVGAVATSPRSNQVTKQLKIPTIGIGAGNQTDCQVLVWQAAFGLNTGRLPRLVKRYADLHGMLLDGARSYAADVKDGSFPGPEHTCELSTPRSDWRCPSPGGRPSPRPPERRNVS